MRSQQGYATVLLMTLTPILLALGALVMVSYSLLKQDLGTLNVCRAAELKIHGKVADQLEKLFRLNPKARKLRKDYLKAQKDLAKAIASKNPPAIALAQLRVFEIFAQREILALQQEGIIATANGFLTSGKVSVPRDIQREWQAHGRPLQLWVRSSLSLNPAKVPELAVRPDLPDLAPAYLTAFNFETAQTWTQSWTVHFEVIGPLKKFLKSKGSYERTCSTSLYEKGTQWVAKLRAASAGKADKLSSKAWF